MTQAPADTVQAQIRAMVAQSDSKQLHEVADNIQSMTLREMALARNTQALLTKSGPAWLKGASPGEIEAFCRASAYLGLNPLVGESYLIHSGFYVSLAGRRKLAQRTGDWDGEDEAVMLTKAEEEVHGVKPGDIARRVQVWRKDVSRPAIGVGIVRAAEQKGSEFLPLVNRPEFMAIKRATAQAYKSAFPDLDVAVVDLEQRGVRAYSVRTVEGAFTELGTYEEPERAALAQPVAPAEPPPPTIYAHSVEPETGEIEPTAAEAALTELDGYVGGLVQWLEQFPAPEGVADAQAIAAAVEAEMEAGAPSLAAAISKVHRTRATGGLSFNSEVILPDDTPPPVIEAEAQPARGRRGQAAPTAALPLE